VLDLTRLVMLRAVAMHGSITAAARELAYSHSAVSQQLALLERETGTVLLEKIGRTARLTPVGLELVRNTEPVLAALERAETALAASHHQPRGIMTVAVFSSVARLVMPAALRTLMHEQPGLELRLRRLDPQEAVLQLIARRVDAVIVDTFAGTQMAPPDTIDAAEIGRDPVRGYLPEFQPADTVEQLQQIPWVMEPADAPSTQWAMRVCREAGFEPRVVHESSDVLFHLRMVEAGLAAAFLPDLVVREARSRLTPSAALPVEAGRTILLLTRSGAADHPAFRAVRSAVAAALAKYVSATDETS
jgi:molybdate transport repressor ModE-like protein